MKLVDADLIADYLRDEIAKNEDDKSVTGMLAKGVLKHLIGLMEDLPAAQPEERTEERTETFACDCISRQAVLAMLDDIEGEVMDGEGYQYGKWSEYVEQLPAAQPDLSSFCDKLWRAAYERGKAEGQRKTGKWWRVAYAQEYKYQCEKCGRFHRAMYDFCPSCGADMREVEHETD